MARKNNGNGATPRNRKSKTTEAAAVPVATETRKNLVPINLEEEIRRRAYELYVERGSTPGNESEDWLTAEREVRSRYEQAARTA
jgi:Protein of unknown function (DUF2934)